MHTTTVLAPTKVWHNVAVTHKFTVGDIVQLRESVLGDAGTPEEEIIDVVQRKETANLLYEMRRVATSGSFNLHWRPTEHVDQKFKKVEG